MKLLSLLFAVALVMSFGVKLLAGEFQAEGRGGCPVLTYWDTAVGDDHVVLVKARAMLSYRFSNVSIASHYQEEGVSFCPVIVHIPYSPNNKVEITAEGTWGQGPTYSHGPEGNGANLSDVHPEYLVDGISIPALTEGSLVGMFTGDWPSITGAGVKTAFKIGKKFTGKVHEGARYLTLGFNDSYEWSNNHGYVIVHLKLK